MKKVRQLRYIFAACCLVYLGWMIHLGSYEFDRINGQYRRIVETLDPDQINTAALKALTDECQRQSSVEFDRKEEACSKWAPSEVEAKRVKIEEGRVQAKKRALIKLILFYMSFVVFFLLTPPVLVYLFIVGIIKIKKHIRIVQ